MEIEKSRISSREMHKYIWMLVGVFSLLAATYPIAMIRVSQKPKFHGYHVKSLQLDGHIANNSVK
ncbi:hypothetical protein HCG51_22385 [Tolypothrix sp. PCC 7910]|uniref:hypothetical protein n=1 Tax=Tolypothrix sp. PCC 7910 TaxID=2099387 RepID=UPI00142795CA|nr:hypothetical protein [Tolypothrix sp. PCC 7910]QIR39183.1 hypothetical protein HCG51_22385 [Tolypothrix sp. PCC 7910]